MGFCCPTGDPSCNCTPMGGFTEVAGQCSLGICDLAPVDWIPGRDAHGCAVFTPNTSPIGCCGCPPPRDFGPPPVDADAIGGDGSAPTSSVSEAGVDDGSAARE